MLKACSVTAKKFDVIVEQSRKLVNSHQFNNEPLRILLASLGSGLGATDAFLASTLSKHMLRELKSYDTALKTPETLRWNNVTKRYGIGTKAEEDDDQDVPEVATRDGDTQSTTQQPSSQPRLPTKENPVGVAIYGQICLAAKSYQSALCKSSNWFLFKTVDQPERSLLAACIRLLSP